jgi:hypothetical protein
MTVRSGDDGCDGSFEQGLLANRTATLNEISQLLKQSVVEFRVRQNLKKFMIHDPKYILISGTMVEH